MGFRVGARANANLQRVVVLDGLVLALHLERMALVVDLLLVRLEHVVRAHLVRG